MENEKTTSIHTQGARGRLIVLTADNPKRSDSKFDIIRERAVLLSTIY